MALKPWALFGALFVTGASASQNLSPVRLLPRDDVSTSIDTADDSELQEWLATLQRAPTLTICPLLCTDAAVSGDGWALFPDPDSIAACNETMLLDVAIQNEADNGQNTKLAIRACAADYSSDTKVLEVDNETAALCSTPNHVMLNTSITLSTSHPNARSSDSFMSQHLLAAGRQVANYLGSTNPSCTHNTLSFSYSQSAMIGVFGGAEVHQHGLTIEALNKFLEYAEQNSVSKTTVVQLCEGDGRGADYGIGIIAGSAINFALIQEAVKTWADGKCLSDVDGDAEWMKVTIRVPKAKPQSANSTEIVTSEGATSPAHILTRWALGVAGLAPRAECRSIEVQAGDGCWALADRCGITQDNLKKFNPRDNFCNTLVIGEPVCCSTGTLPDTIPPGNSDGTCKTIDVISGDSCGSLASKCGLSSNEFMEVNTKENLCATLAVGQPVCCTRGDLPDLRPVPKPDGYCFDSTIVQDDYCSTIAAKNGLTVDDLESFNKNTWGWNGCQLLYPGTKICLSTGTPPMPAPVSNAICGPTVPGTEQPPSGTNISSLNPCPLSACCNIWGQCGLTEDFCVVSRSESGAPGTSAPGENGCIFNCGMDIIKGSAPTEKINVAYFEAFDGDRECLHMDVDQVDKDRYSHIHFAFVDIMPDFRIDVTSVQAQFDIFKGMTGIKKIVSFGGWAFSNDPGTFSILREATKPANRPTFVKNIIEFVNNNHLDGVDLDWEYPGAPDIPGVPPGNPEEGNNYYQTLLSLKEQMDSGKSVSFAAPASYHYLKSFPMKKMGEFIDYVIFMTYDLHGQWDYGNEWTSPGCPTGNCLRSHINETETKDALAMITKAGVPSGKVVVGVASYGRSFKMAAAGCDGPDCKFTGTNSISDAAKGRCTATKGYIANAELAEIIESGRVTRQWEAAGSNLLVYDDTEWVAYMDEDLKSMRAAFYDSYNFAGTTDWAVDLQKFWGGSGGGGGGGCEGGGGGGDDGRIDECDNDGNYEDEDYPPCTGTYSAFEHLENSKDKIPGHCLEKYILDVEIAVMEKALKQYQYLVDGDYDEKFRIYADYVEEQVPDQIDLFVGDNGDGYFQCQETKEQQCGSDCSYVSCYEDCNHSDECDGGFVTIDIECPKNLRDHDTGLGSVVPNTTFVMEDEDGFFDDILDEYGIEQSWIKFGRESVKRPTNGCQYAGEKVNECIEKRTTYWYDYPQKGDVKVTNPKDIIGDSYDESKGLLDRLKEFQGDDIDAVDLWIDGVTWMDMADAAVMPALSMEQAVKSMEDVVKDANEIQKAEREEFILNFLSGLLFFIPVIGSAIGGATMASVRAMLHLIGAVGEAGLLVYSIIENPDNAYMAIFSSLAGASLGRGGFREAAVHKRSMSSSEINDLGRIKDKLNVIDNIRGSRSCSAR